MFISSHKWRTNVQQTWSLGTVISLNPSHWEQLSISYAYTAESVSEGTQSETIWNRERERNRMDQSNIWCTDLKKKTQTFALLLHFFKIGSWMSIIIFIFLRLRSYSHGCLIYLPKYFLTKFQGSFCFPNEKVMGLSAPGPFLWGQPRAAAQDCCPLPYHMLSPLTTRFHVSQQQKVRGEG